MINFIHLHPAACRRIWERHPKRIYQFFSAGYSRFEFCVTYTFMRGPIEFYHCAKVAGFFRLFGYGLRWKHALQPLLYSERNGHVKLVRIGGWRFGVLRKEKHPKTKYTYQDL